MAYNKIKKMLTNPAPEDTAMEMPENEPNKKKFKSNPPMPSFKKLPKKQSY